MERYSIVTREGFLRIEEDSRGQWVKHDGAFARIAALEAQVKALTEERDANKHDADNLEDIINKLWTDIIIKHKPSYGDWEYPGQAYRHIVAEFDDLRKDRDAQAEAVRVLGEEAYELRKRYIEQSIADAGSAAHILFYATLAKELKQAMLNTTANPIAAAAVKGEKES